MNNSKRGYFILAILFIVISVIAFAVPTDKTATFFVAYAFTVIAIIAQYFIWKKALKPEAMKSKFLGFPLIHIGVVYLITQIVTFIVFLLAPSLPTWSAVIVCVLIAAIAALCCISLAPATEETERVGKKVDEKVFFIKSLQVDIELMAEQEEDAATKQALNQLAEKIRFSDPMSHEKLAALEGKIVDKVDELKTSENKMEIIKEIGLLFDERNRKCIIMK